MSRVIRESKRRHSVSFCMDTIAIMDEMDEPPVDLGPSDLSRVLALQEEGLILRVEESERLEEESSEGV